MLLELFYSLYQKELLTNEKITCVIDSSSIFFSRI